MSSAAKFVTVVAKIGDVTIPISSISFRHAINTLPMVEFTTQLNNTGSSGGTEMDLTKFTALNIITQQKFYNTFSLNPDVNISVVDGDGNSMNFVGFLMQPVFRIISGQLNLVFSAIHVGAVFQAFNGSVYDLVPYYAGNVFSNYFAGINHTTSAGLLSQLENLPPINGSEAAWSKFMGNTETLFNPVPSAANNYKAVASPRSNSIAHRIYTILRNSHADDLRYLNGALPEIQAFFNFAVLTENSSVLPFIRNLLMGSFATTLIDGLVEFSKEQGSDNITPSDSSLNETIFRIFSSAPDFLSAIFTYINPFLFQLNATWDGRMAFEPNQFITAPGKRLIQTPIQDLNVNLASMHELPLAQVIVQYQPEEYYALGGNMGTDRIPVQSMSTGSENNSVDVTPQNIDLQTAFNQIVFLGNTFRFLAKYPPAPVVPAGRYLSVTAPSWTAPCSYIGSDVTDLTVGNRFISAPTRYSQQQSKLVALHKSRVNILNYLAKSTYESNVLAKTNAFFSVPLNLQVQVGRTYNVQSMEGAGIFSGFLNSVTHTISLGEEGGSATTSLDFSHIVVTGAQLNGINDSSVKNAAPDINPSAVAGIA